MGRRRRIGRRRSCRRRRRRRERRRAGPVGSGESAGAATAVASVLSSLTQAADQQQLKMDSKLVFPLTLLLLATIIDSGELTVLILTDVKPWEGKDGGKMGPHDMLPAMGALTNGRRTYRRLDCEMCEKHPAGGKAEHHGVLPAAAAAFAA